MHIFGCEAYIHIPKQNRRKLDDKAEKLIFIGYSEQSKAYRFLNPRTEQIKISRDVIFLDSVHRTCDSIKEIEKKAVREDDVFTCRLAPQKSQTI